MLQQAKFHIGAASVAQLPRDSVCEVAFAGRSNAGKSSALNALTNRRKLAFVSKTPGRTQELNYFNVAPGKYLVDLPGYGFAKVPLAVQQRWQRLLTTYLQTRDALSALVVIMDVRHPLTDLDRQLLDWFSSTEKPVLVLLTKADKLSRQQQRKQLHAVEAELARNFPGASAALLSSTTGIGVPEARARIEGLLRAAQRGDRNTETLQGEPDGHVPNGHTVNGDE